jgi:hypothetical protein
VSDAQSQAERLAAENEARGFNPSGFGTVQPTEPQAAFEAAHHLGEKPPAQHVQVMPAELSGSAGQNG